MSPLLSAVARVQKPDSESAFSPLFSKTSRRRSVNPSPKLHCVYRCHLNRYLNCQRTNPEDKIRRVAPQWAEAGPALPLKRLQTTQLDSTRLQETTYVDKLSAGKTILARPPLFVKGAASSFQKKLETTGIEPATSAVQGRRSPN